MPKRVPPLSARALATVRAPAEKPIELADGFIPGLRVRVYSDGTRAWSLNIRDSKGERRRFEVGRDLGLAEARKKAEHLRRSIRDGADPTTERRLAGQRAKAAREGIGTFEALIDTYFRSGPGARQRRVEKTKQIIKTVFSRVMRSPAVDLDRVTLQLTADDWRSSNTAASAVRSLRACLKWAEKRGLVRSDVSDLECPGKPTKRSRFLAAEEIAAIWPLLEGSHGQVMKWLLWTGCRLNEAAGMTWQEVQSGIWTIPAARAKNNRERDVPLPSQAIAFLQTLPQSACSALVFPPARGEILGNWDRETKRLHERSGTSGWHRHDLRRTVATMLGDLGIAPHVISAVLGHAHIAVGATATYALSRYGREHKQALQALADELDRIVALEADAVAAA
jgi:integrase